MCISKIRLCRDIAIVLLSKSEKRWWITLQCPLLCVCQTLPYAFDIKFQEIKILRWLSNRKETSFLVLASPGFEPGRLRNPISSRLTARSQTHWAIEDQANLEFESEQTFSPLDTTASSPTLPNLLLHKIWTLSQKYFLCPIQIAVIRNRPNTHIGQS